MPTLDDIVKISQICFYGGTLLIGVRTYIYAKKNILNSVHLEYQKKVINKLEEVSFELFREFNPEDEKYWGKQYRFSEQLERVDTIFEEHKDIILKERKFDLAGVPEHPIPKHLNLFLTKMKSDPFIPQKLRSIIVDFLENRVHFFRNIWFAEYKQYLKDLATGKLSEVDRETRHGIVHNRINDGLNKMGCGISDCEREVNDIRLTIQQYFEEYNPINKTN